jgi:uncharacterized membrane protein
MSDQGTSQPAQGAILPNAPGAVPSLVLGIIGVALCWCYAIGLVPSIIGLVFGVKSRKVLADSPTKYQGKGMATAGFVLSIIGVVSSAIAAVIYVLVAVLVWSHVRY